MKLIYKPNGKTYDIYDIKYDKIGYPHFLIYSNNQWILKSAKYFKPTTTDGYYATE